MNQYSLKIIFSGFICLCLLLPGQVVKADDGNVYDMITQVNAVRVSKGLSPLETDGSLMAIAQAHAEYMASTGICTHEGPGGTRPKDRAIAAGYGGGGTVWATENIYCSGRSVSEVVTWWQGDDLHLLPFVESSYRSVGGGIALGANGQTYYVLDAAYTSGGTGGTISKTTTSGGVVVPNPPSISQKVSPVITATMQPDGSLVHEVQAGQAYWSIAIAYNMKINEIIQLNGLSSGSVLRIGQKLTIHGPFTATPDLSPTPSLEPETPTPTITQTPTITLTPTLTYTPTPRPLFESAAGLQNLDRRSFGVGLVVVCVLGLGLMILGGFRRKKKLIPEEYDPLDPPIDSL
ncbi:MAG: CAP domain-containing protein [Leptolinea sp.]